MKYDEVPIKSLASAEDVLLIRDLPDTPDWNRNPYLPIIKGDKIEVARLNRQHKVPHYWERYEVIHVVSTDAWWLDNEHTFLAIRCKWECKEGNVWWKKRNTAVWCYERADGVWHKRRTRLHSKFDVRNRAIMKAIAAFQELDW